MNPNGRARKYPRAKIGDKFGQQRVVGLLPPKRSNERVRILCVPCGKERDAYVFNLRKGKSCPRCRRPRAWTQEQRAVHARKAREREARRTNKLGQARGGA